MAQYEINFQTNASSVEKDLALLQKKLSETVQLASRSLKINLDTSGLSNTINTTFRQINKEIESNQRKLSRLQIGGGNFQAIARRLGEAEGKRERGQMIAEPIRLRAQAGLFEPGSLVATQKVLQAIRIEASQVKPNSQEWVRFQQQIGDVALQMQRVDKAAESIQLTQQLGALAPGSLASLETRLTILRNRAREISPNTTEWTKLNREIQRTEAGIGKISKKPLTTGQRFGAAGGAFLYGGGLGGGAGSALGGIAGGLAGGVPGAFTGAAIGQAVDNLGMMTSGIVEQATQINKLRNGLAGASTDLGDFAEAVRAVNDISTKLLLPVDQVTRNFTQLRASTVALGIDTKTTAEIFEGTTAAVLRSGGSLDDVSGAMRAVVQVFSKGKLTAEELRGQLAERLPGAVVDFARSAGMSVQELDKAFDKSTTTIDDFVTFLRGKAKESETFVGQMGTSSEFAGARLAKAFENMRLNIGNALQPAGASIQDFIAKSIRGFDRLIRKMIEFQLIQPGAGFYVEEALAGRNGGVAGLEQRILELATEEADIVAGLDRFGVGFAASVNPRLREIRKVLPELEEALRKLRGYQAQTKPRPTPTAGPGVDEKEQERRAKQYLDAIESREQSLAQARIDREERLARIRKDAIEKTKQVEADLAKQRLDAEREIEKVRREISDIQANVGFGIQALGATAAGANPEIIRFQQEIFNAARKRDEDKIAAEQQLMDEQAQRAKAIEDLKVTIAQSINEANVRYAKAIGDAQLKYAQAAAKIAEEGSQRSAKRLEIAGKLVALSLDRANLNYQRVLAGEGPIPGPADYQDGEPRYQFSNGRFKASRISGFPERFATIDTEYNKLSQSLAKIPALTGVASTGVTGISVNISDLIQRVTAATGKVNELGQSLRTAIGDKATSEFEATYMNSVLSRTEDLQRLVVELRRNSAKAAGVQTIRQRTGANQDTAETIYNLNVAEEELAALLNTASRTVEGQFLEKLITQDSRDRLIGNLTKIQELVDTLFAEGQIELQKLITPDTFVVLTDAIQDSRDALNKLVAPSNQIITIANGIGSAFSEAFTGLISGASSAREVMANFFKSLSDMFAQMVAEIINQWIKIQVIEGLRQLLSPAINMFSGMTSTASDIGFGGSFDAGIGGLTGIPDYSGAFGGGMGATAFTGFATGGVVTGPTLGLVGEGRYNEAIVPLPDGRSIPVDLGGGMGGSTNVVVNVDAKGTKVQGDEPNANQLGRVVSAAVQAELIKHKRPGGLLSA